MAAPGGEAEGAAGAGTDVKLYRRIPEDMVAGLPRERRAGGVRKLVELLRELSRQAGREPPEWLDGVLQAEER